MKNNASSGQSYLVPVFVVFVFVIIGLLVTSLTLAPKKPARTTINGTACTKEAKLCPDGSAVGRSGPDCQFTPCPAGATNSSANSTNQSANINVPTGSDQNTVCATDSDCRGPICRRCYNQTYVQTWKVFPACAQFAGDSCHCQAHACTLVTNSVVNQQP